MDTEWVYWPGARAESPVARDKLNTDSSCVGLETCTYLPHKRSQVTLFFILRTAWVYLSFFHWRTAGNKDR